MSETHEYHSFYYDDLKHEPVLDDFLLPSSTEMTPELLLSLIREHEECRRPRYKRLKAAYDGKFLIYDDSNAKPDYRPDNRISVEFPRYLTDTFGGYFIGVPVDYRHSDEAKDEWLTRYERRVGQDDIDADIAEACDMYGNAFELLYQNEGGLPSSTFLSPLMTFVIYDDSVRHEPLFGVRYAYDEEGKLKGSFCDANYVVRFNENGDTLAFEPPESHYFGGVPIIEYVENSQKRGLYEGALSMIEAYSKVLSEKANDVEYFAEAYLKVIGVEVDEDMKDDIREKRIINLYDGGGGSEPLDADFMSKPNADATQENFLNRVEMLIFKTQMVPDITDDRFSTASGTALKWRLLPMSNLARKKERKFIKSVRRRLELLANYPNQVFTGDDWLDVEIVMKRNMPDDLPAEAQTASGLSGIVSEETQLSLLSCVDDPKREMERKQAEKASAAEALTDGYSTNRRTAREPSMYEITSILDRRRRKAITYNNALAMLERIGVDKDTAELYLNDTDEEE